MAFDPSDRLEAAIREFCYGPGRAIPRSVFLGRVVGPPGGCDPCRWGWPRSMCVCEPEWLEADWLAALEWQAYQKSLCPGCGRPRDESFDSEMEEHYEVTPLTCHSCAHRDFTAYNRVRENQGRPLFGEFYIVRPEEPAQAVG